MVETFLVLFAAGTLLAAAVCEPAQVTLRWLRLAGIIALALAALGLFFLLRRDVGPSVQQVTLFIALLAAIVGQLALVQSGAARPGRPLAAGGYVIGVALGYVLLPPPGLEHLPLPMPWSSALVCWSLAGVAAMCGLALMDMLLGHAYLTAAHMTMRPFERLNLTLAVVMILRGISSIGVVCILDYLRPVPMLWSIEGLLIGVRWFVGLAVPGAFVYMAHDCIRRRATQSATGILYVAGVLIMAGELTALLLVRDTRLPF